MIDGADERLKNSVGWAAYVLSALRHLRERPVKMVLQADSGRPQRRWASGVIVGNVGSLQGNIQLLPDAVPHDGVLDVAVLAASGWAGWLRLAADVLLRRRTGRVAHLTCCELVIDTSRARPWEVDGEVAGCTRQLRVTLEPGSLLTRVPAAARRLPARLSALPRLALLDCGAAAGPAAARWVAGGWYPAIANRRQRKLNEQRQPSDSPRWPGGEVKTSNPAPTTKRCRRGRSCRRCERARDLADGRRCR
jgi:YegS C-terminal NAD kinase beta sandwich-like domain